MKHVKTWITPVHSGLKVWDLQQDLAQVPVDAEVSLVQDCIVFTIEEESG